MSLLKKYGIDLEYSNDNKQRDIATSNFNYGQIDLLGPLYKKNTDVEKDKFVMGEATPPEKEAPTVVLGMSPE